MKKRERKVIRTEEEAWKYINKYKWKREGLDENIKLESWKKNFMDTLGGEREKTTNEGRRDG